MSSKLETAMNTVIAVFNGYSGKEGDKYKLNKAELTNLFQKELGGWPKPSDDPRAGDIMKLLDADKDGEVNFEEFAILVATLIMSKKPGDKSEKNPSTLQKAMKTITDVFYEYSGKEGDKNKLNKGEVKSLFQTELKNFIDVSKDQAINSLMKDLDNNSDGEVDFLEFVILVVTLIMITHEFFTESDKTSKK
ncbi:Protein S100-A1 S-100 protein alpha chain S-100 protein subunit alpha [Channa argus]|uniref:Protein S100-A1 S-100 protein alpha chain S-100 protein subunit alpha n=1 Tax=Channa argus TaxID=215402 RepID=A0A6G1PQA6_CHAAH|nr:Protein S100-A1 S-100 protein alpha chain S-100 protein subunit alpha [Channa argus]